MPEISIKAEKIFEIFGVEITNSLLLSSIVFLVFSGLAIKYFFDSKRTRKSTYYYLVNFILKNIYQLFQSILHEKTDYFFPLLASFFIFILLQNWFGLLPGVGSILINHVPLLRGGNADLNTTLSLALLSVVLTQVFGIKYLGFKRYISKFINFANPIAFFTGILEITSEFSKIISFSFRLFGNIFAGEVLLTIMAFLIPVLASFPFLLLEVFVGLIQALVFSMLTAVFLNLAINTEH
ncbi:MAG: F0F1 ATP synthase subunit A [Microgenomates group bacterium]